LNGKRLFWSGVMSTKTKSAIAFSLSQGILMSYKDKLNPWCIIRPMSDVQMRIVRRFRRRVDAEGHLKILKRMIPDVPFEIMFDIPSEQTDSEDLTPPTPLPSQGYALPTSFLTRE
jgi:hypothetical protein